MFGVTIYYILRMKRKNLNKYITIGLSITFIITISHLNLPNLKIFFMLLFKTKNLFN